MMTKIKNIGLFPVLEYSPNPTKLLCRNLHSIERYNQAVENHNSIEADAIQDVLATEIMVLREKNAELLQFIKDHYRYLNLDDQKKAESLINSNH